MSTTLTSNRPSPPRAARRRRERISATLTYIALVAAAVFALAPILWALSTAFKPADLVLTSTPQWIPTEFTLDNFRAVFRSAIPAEIANTAMVSGLTIFATLLVSVPAAYATVRLRMRGQAAVLFIILMTSMIPGIAVLLPLFYMSVKTGLYDSFTGLVIAFTAWQVPITVWLMRGFIAGIPAELEDAARVDGCSRLGAFARVTLPLLRPGLAAASMLIVIFVWNDFLLASSLISDESRRLVNVGLYHYLSVYGIVWHELMAAVITALCPVIVLFLIVERHLVTGLSGGALKG